MTDQTTTQTTRRTVLLTTVSAIAASAGAGCMGTDAEDDGGPKYDPEAELDLPAEEIDERFENQDVTDGGYENPEFQFEFEEDGDGTVAVMIHYELFKDSEAASESYAESAQKFENTNDLDDLGDEAFWAERPDNARCFIRDGNLLLQDVAARQSGLDVVPDQSRAIDYAAAALNYWQEEYADE